MKLTAGEIAKLLGISRPAIIKRAKAENWKYEEEPNPRGGKPLKKFIIEELPSDIKEKIKEKIQCNLNVTNETNVTDSNVTCGQNQKSAKNKKSEIAIENQKLSLEYAENETTKNLPENLELSTKISAESSKKGDLELLHLNATESSKESSKLNVTFKNQSISNVTQKSNVTSNVTNATNQSNVTFNVTLTSNVTESSKIPEWIPLPKLAQILKMNRETLRQKAERENWQCREVPVRGGYRKEFLLDKLPQEIKLKVYEHYTGVHEDFIPTLYIATSKELSNWQRLFELAPEEYKKEARAKLEILKAYELFRKKNPHLKETEAKEQFVKLFNSGKIHVSFEALECGIHKITVKSLYRWIKLREEGGLAALLPKHSEKGRRRKITRETELFVFEYIKKTKITRGKRIYEAIRYHYHNGKLSDPPPSYQAFMSWYREWQKRNELFILKYTDPDNYKRKLPSYGSIYASYNPEYYGQILMLDATKADVMCKWKEKQADGSYIEKERRLSLSILIDLYSRDIRFALAENENSLLVVNNLLRRWILEVGVPEVIVTDNSKIYRSEHLAQVCEALGIKLIHTDSYAPEQKPHVERVFGTIATQLFEVLEGYVGHNVTERRKIEARKKFRDKIFKKKDYFIEVYLTPEEFEKKLSDYVEKRYRKEKHSFGIVEQLILNSPRKPKTIRDERVLDILLSKFERRTLSNKGIRLHNRYYFSKELAEICYQQGAIPVLVKYDISDVSTIYVFDEKGRYLCKAFDHQEAGKKLEEAIKAKKVFKKKEKELESLIKQNQKLSATPYEIATSIYSFEAEHKVIPFDRRPQDELETETVREARKIVKETEETRKLIEETAKDTFFTSPLKRAKALFRKIEKGEPITKEDYAFLKAYVESEEFRKYSRMEVFGRTFKNLRSIEELDIKLA